MIDEYTKEIIKAFGPDSPGARMIGYIQDYYDPKLTRAQREAIVLPVIPSDNIGRNDKCKCGSGKKYKKCCLDINKGDSRGPDQVGNNTTKQ